MKREDGFYWVKLDGEWEVGEYKSRRDFWFICGYEPELRDNDFDEIGEQIKKPDI